MTERRAVLDQLNIVVRDMDASIEFYEKLGVEIPDTLPEWRAHHRTVDVGGDVPGDGLHVDLDSSAFAPMWNAGWRQEQGGGGVVLGFRLRSREDVDALYAELTVAGHRSQQAPYDAFWGARYAVVEDPSGNSVGLMSPVDPSRRTDGPTPPPD